MLNKKKKENKPDKKNLLNKNQEKFLEKTKEKFLEKKEENQPKEKEKREILIKKNPILNLMKEKLVSNLNLPKEEDPLKTTRNKPAPKSILMTIAHSQP